MIIMKKNPIFTVDFLTIPKLAVKVRKAQEYSETQ